LIHINTNGHFKLVLREDINIKDGAFSGAKIIRSGTVIVVFIFFFENYSKWIGTEEFA